MAADIRRWKVETESGRTVTVGGTIDRVDAYHRSEGTYVRVVDYKTGKKRIPAF